MSTKLLFSALRLFFFHSLPKSGLLSPFSHCEQQQQQKKEQNSEGMRVEKKPMEKLDTIKILPNINRAENGRISCCPVYNSTIHDDKVKRNGKKRETNNFDVNLRSAMLIQP